MTINIFLLKDKRPTDVPPYYVPHVKYQLQGAYPR